MPAAVVPAQLRKHIREQVRAFYKPLSLKLPTLHTLHARLQ